MNATKPKSQMDKRIDAMGTGGKEYYAGEGLGLSDNTFILRTASSSTLGGVRLVGTENISPDDPSAKFGIFKEGYDGFPALRTALSYQKGGFFLGDGFVPELVEKEQYGETYYSPNGYVHLRLGDGLEFADNDETATDPKEIRENSTGGRRVAVKVDGQTVKVNDKGELSAEGYAEGAAIVFRTAGEQKSINVKYDDETIVVDGGKLKVNIDGETLKINDDGKLESSGVIIENAVVIQEADAKYLLHEYTEVEYIAGNKIGYAGPLNQIITQGYILYAWGGTAPNGVTINSSVYRSTELSDIPDIPLYQRIDFSPSAYIGTIGWTISVEMLLDSMTSTSAVYKMRYTREDGSTSEDSQIYNYNGYVGLGFGYLWTSLLPPGAEYQGRTFEYGCAVCQYTNRSKSTATQYTMNVTTNATYNVYLPFASEAEYNAAVGLTYEPVTLTEVTETITEV